MNSIAKHLVVLSFVVVATIAFSAQCQASPGAEKIKEDAKATFEKAKDTVHDVVAEVKDATRQGSHKATEAASTVSVQVKTTVHKANEATTRIIGTTRQTVTDTHARVKETIKSVTH